MRPPIIPLHQQGADFNNSIVAIHHGSNESLRLYQVWKGSNKFFFGGRLVFGPDVRSLLLTLFLILAPVIMFCVFVTQRLANELPPHIGQLTLVVCIVLTVNIIGLLLLTSGRDPGIIPRNPFHPEPEDEGDTSSISTDWTGSMSGIPSIPPTKNVIVNGMVVRVKYCQTCKLYRPPRCSHCSICNNCVERFDHHCPWVGQCIGKRNYRYFFMFISSTTVLCLYVFSLCWLNVKKLMEVYTCGLWKAVSKSPISGVLIVYTFLVSWFVGGLTMFHLYLTVTNQTTYENFRYRYDRKMNPHNLGCFRNFRETFFSKMPRSKNNFREKVKVVSSPSSIHNSSTYMGMSIRSDMQKISFNMGMEKKMNSDTKENVQSQTTDNNSISATVKIGNDR